MTNQVDVLAICAHPDDSELICGGTLARTVALGHRAGVVALTNGELGSRGSVEIRASEAAAASKTLGLSFHESLGLPDGAVLNTPENRTKLAVFIRRSRPSVVITHWLQGRHPDHAATAQLVRDACFVAGLKNIEPEVPPHRPTKILHALSFREDNEKPTFVVDISESFEKKLEAIKCYASQFADVKQAGELFPNGEPLFELIRHHAAHYGSLIRARYGEPFHTSETMKVDDVTKLEVSSL
jgi:bacillithiol biosynthesis deacetylase BshB1